MAGWSESEDGLELKNQENSCESHTMSSHNLDFTVKDSAFDDSKDTMKSLFDQVIPIYLREISVDDCAGPLPALLSNGQQVDLFDLFWVVKRKGGFCNVSENGLWGSVAELCGFSTALMSSVELVYIKYLKDLDGWLRKVYMDKKLENGEIQNFKKLGLLIEDSEELKGLVCSDADKERNDGKVEPEFGGTGSPSDNYGSKHGSQLSDDVVHLNEVNHAVENSTDIEKDICIQHDKSITFSAKSFVDNIISSRKKKLCSEAKVDKVQDKIEASRSYVGNRNLGVKDDYDIVLSARSVVENVISAMKNEYLQSPEVANVRQNDQLLSAKRIVDTVNSRNKVNNSWSREGINAVHENAGSTKADSEKVHIPDNASGGNPVVSRKRKQEYTSLPGMLKWMNEVAKRPTDPAIGVIPGPSEWKSNETKEYWKQALLAREALLVKRPIYPKLEEYLSQKKQKMHPSMYEDTNVIQQTRERVRCSKIFPSKFQFASPKEEKSNGWKLSSSPMRAGILSRRALDVSQEEDLVSYVSVGLTFQAEVPEWTGVALESDPKWLGIQMWAPEGEHNKTTIKKHPIGKGRPSVCDCLIPGSSACIGFHIAEKRLELKLALGVLFYRWKFNRMGEEVSLSWTEEEEKRFMAMLQQDSTGHNKFWNNAFKLFPCKTRENLVSYYFNVFVLRRRSYQNRATPETTDSDDDETEFGSIDNSAYFAGNLAPVYYLT